MMKKELRQSNISLEPEPKDNNYIEKDLSVIESLNQEIQHILERNQNEKFLHCILRCVIAYEKALKS